MSTNFEKPFDPKKGQPETEICATEQMRRNSLNRLQEIRDIIREPKTIHIYHDVCKKAGIILQELSLDESSKYRPIFFDPYRDQLHDLTEPDDLRHEYDEKHNRVNQAGILSLFLQSYVSSHRPKGVCGSDRVQSWDDISCHDLYELSLEWPWGVNVLLIPAQYVDGSNFDRPHVRCMMENGIKGDDRLLRGEILAMTRLMMARLRARSLKSHLIAPILIFSVMAPWHFRALEAYYDGSNLVVRSTQLYDMREKSEDEDCLQNLTRWWFGDYGGETQVLPVYSKHSDCRRG